MADTLELKNGSIIKGTYVGGSETQISFRVASSVQQFAVQDVLSLKFDSRPAAPSAPAATPSSSPALLPHSAHSESMATRSSSSPRGLTVPSGTRLVVRTIDSIDSDQNHPGDKFQASLEQPLYVNETLVAAKGTSIYGRLDQIQGSGQLSGKAQLRLSLTGIVLNGQTIPLTTGDYEVAGKSRGASTAKKVGGGAALGAVIGAIAGGGKGAAIGAGVGAGAGTAVQVMTKGDQIHVPSETLLEFNLDQPVTLPSSPSAQMD
ncbi:MAG TPA: hypothetical protein VJN64_09405 [Terriglobales bacterium]|nr:hypothetical protein [Terriglobales bacterium]